MHIYNTYNITLKLSDVQKSRFYKTWFLISASAHNCKQGG